MTYKSLVYKIAEKLVFMNLFGMLISTMWMMSKSGWKSVGIGICIITFSRHIIPLLLAPSALFSNFMLKFKAKQNVKMERIMFFSAMAYIVIFFSIWISLIFNGLIVSTNGSIFVPELIWSSSTAMAPLFIWVITDKDNPFMVTMVEICQLSVFLIAVLKFLYSDMIFFESLVILLVSIGSITAISFAVEKLVTARAVSK